MSASALKVCSLNSQLVSKAKSKYFEVLSKNTNWLWILFQVSQNTRKGCSLSHFLVFSWILIFYLVAKSGYLNKSHRSCSNTKSQRSTCARNMKPTTPTVDTQLWLSMWHALRIEEVVAVILVHGNRTWMLIAKAVSIVAANAVDSELILKIEHKKHSLTPSS